jgi:hypothetical protein
MHPKGNWMLRTLTEMVYPINIEKLESKPFFLSGADFWFFDKTITVFPHIVSSLE